MYTKIKKIKLHGLEFGRHLAYLFIYVIGVRNLQMRNRILLIIFVISMNNTALPNSMLWPFLCYFFIGTYITSDMATLDARYSMRNALNSGRLKLP